MIYKSRYQRIIQDIKIMTYEDQSLKNPEHSRYSKYHSSVEAVFSVPRYGALTQEL